MITKLDAAKAVCSNCRGDVSWVDKTAVKREGSDDYWEHRITSKVDTWTSCQASAIWNLPEA